MLTSPSVRLTRSAAAAGGQAIRNFDMVLLDVNLPGMSGLDLLRQIRQLDPSIIVLIITAHGNIRDAVKLGQKYSTTLHHRQVQTCLKRASLHRGGQRRCAALAV